MLRLLSLLLLIGGAFAIWIGGQSFLEKSEREARKSDAQIAAASQPAPAPAPVSETTPASEPAPVEEIATEPDTDATPALIETSEDFVEPAPVVVEPDAPKGKAPSRARSVKPQMSGDPDMAGAQEVITRSMQAVEESATSGFDQPAPVASMPPPPAAAVVTPAPPAKTAAQAFIDSLTEVPIAHETPSSAEYKQAFNVTFAIDATGDSSAVEALPGKGNVVEGSARVSDRVEVRVIGASFDIEAKSPEIQSLSPVNENTWRWSVTPLTAGSHDLVFEVYAIDQDNVVPLRTFTDKVTVQVSGINQVVAFADQANPLFVLLGGIGSALGGLFGAFSFFKRRK